MKFNTVYMVYTTYLIVQICFQSFMSLKRIGFQRQRKVVFFEKTQKSCCISSQASTFTDNRQKSGKKNVLLLRSNIGIYDFVKIRRTFINVLYLFLNLRYIHA